MVDDDSPQQENFISDLEIQHYILPSAFDFYLLPSTYCLFRVSRYSSPSLSTLALIAPFRSRGRANKMQLPGCVTPNTDFCPQQ